MTHDSTAQPPPTHVPHLEMRNITKDFPGVRALDRVSLAVRPGEIHALCGENGAGKSTLIKILSGVYPTGSYEGEVVLRGTVQHFSGIRDAAAAGISVIYQELALVKEMTVGENIFLGNEPRRFGVIDWDRVYAGSSEILKKLGLYLNPRTEVRALGIGQQQLIEIAKALSKKSELLILDEPTAALSEEEIRLLMRILNTLRRQGVTCIYISHKLGEVLSIADRVSVLRDGRHVGTQPVDRVDEHALVSMMVGRTFTDFYPREPHQRGERAVSVRNLTLYDPELPGRKIVDQVSFDIYRGEVLGISGLMGAGRTELLMGLFGAWPGRREGSMEIEGQPVSIRHPADAIAHGLGLVGEDRKRYGLLPDANVEHNLSLSSLPSIARSGVIVPLRELARSREQVHRLGIKVPSLEAGVNTLSGGNQQKVVLGKWLLTRPKVLFLDEPTRGIDVGAKYEIYQLMNRLVADGLAVVMVSSELPEILGMSDRILVLNEGRLRGEFQAADATQERIMLAATGHAGPAPVPLDP